MKLPKGIRPIEPEELLGHVDEEDYAIELKYEGFRAIFYQDAETCELRSKKNHPFTQFPNLSRAICRDLGTESAILDGVIVVLDPAGRSHLAELLRHPRRAVFLAFDLLFLAGQDLRLMPWLSRKSRLEKLLPPDLEEKKAVRYLPHWWNISELGADEFIVDWKEFVLKRKSDPYLPETKWYKITNPAAETSALRAI